LAFSKSVSHIPSPANSESVTAINTSPNTQFFFIFSSFLVAAYLSGFSETKPSGLP